MAGMGSEHDGVMNDSAMKSRVNDDANDGNDGMNGNDANANGAQETAPATIWDVAAAAGVSPTTVSRAFRQPSRVNVKTLGRVLDAAKRLGYRSESIIPREEEHLRGLLALVVTDLENPVSAQFARSIQRECAERNFGLMVCDTEEDKASELAIIKRSIPHVDGIILSASRLSDATIRKVAQVRPLAVINRIVGGVQSVYADDGDSIADAVRELKRLGHQQITYLPGPDSSWQNGLRANAILTACKREGLRFRRTPCAYPVGERSAEAFAAYLARPTTAAIAFNDDVAYAFMLFLEAHRLRVPWQVSLVGIDDTPKCEICTPKMSSIRVPRRELGAAAANRIIDRLLHVSDGDLTPIRMQSEFVKRDSIAAAPASSMM